MKEIWNPIASFMLILKLNVYFAASRLAFASIRVLVTSINTAAMITRPITIYCTELEVFKSVKPFRMVDIINAPIKVPQMVPFPPIKEAPPIIHAAMASVSYGEMAAEGLATADRPTITSAAMEHIKPDKL